MNQKVIEICYDIARIPGANAHNALDKRALRFRDAAAQLIEAALLEEGLGACIGQDVRDDEVSFRLAVSDFDDAEAAIWRAVEATPYAGLREILRYWDHPAAA